MTKPGHLEKQYSQDAPVSEPSKPGYNVKNPPFPSGSLGKMQSSGLQNCPRTSTAAQSTVLGQFWRPLDCIFPRIPRKKVESWPKTHNKCNGNKCNALLIGSLLSFITAFRAHIGTFDQHFVTHLHSASRRPLYTSHAPDFLLSFVAEARARTSMAAAAMLRGDLMLILTTGPKITC